jgi:hypothetical protein
MDTTIWMIHDYRTVSRSSTAYRLILFLPSRATKVNNTKRLFYGCTENHFSELAERDFIHSLLF